MQKREKHFFWVKSGVKKFKPIKADPIVAEGTKFYKII